MILSMYVLHENIFTFLFYFLWELVLHNYSLHPYEFDFSFEANEIYSYKSPILQAF